MSAMAKGDNPSAPGDGEPAALRLSGTDIWSSEADDALVCRAVREETHDVKTFVLSPRNRRRFQYRPGQFLACAFNIGGETIHRCYTISSAPTRPDTISITVKRVAKGLVSNWLHDNLRAGAQVKALGPMGEFSCFAHPASRYLFRSGGSGVTPLMSMARTFHDLAEPRDVVFVHSARTSADIVFREELELMARLNPSFRFAPICGTATPTAPFNGLRGRLSAAILSVIAPDFLTREVFVCGPAPYMEAVREMLAASGFDMTKHHEENFDFAALSAGARTHTVVAETALDAATGLQSYRVEFVKTRRVIECSENLTVLEAAMRAGLRLPSSCAKGMCGTCKSKIVSGTVEMSHAGGIRQREIDAGMALLCCSKPTSDLVVER
jgi:ferredoxin-NADP reductase